MIPKLSVSLGRAKGKRAQAAAAGPSFPPGHAQQPGGTNEVFQLACWTYDVSRDAIMYSIEKDKMVTKLKSHIKNRQHALKDVDEDCMDLWKVSISLSLWMPALITLPG